MSKRADKILILGGTGNFGARITKALLLKGLPVIITGRDQSIGEKILIKLKIDFPKANVSFVQYSLDNDFTEVLTQQPCGLVIHTAGPFQGADYAIAKTCIARGISYIDLADGRDFVPGITSLNGQAKKSDCFIISGASTVPTLSSAVVSHFQNQFSQIDHMHYGISVGQNYQRGLATTKAILHYVGKPLKPFPSPKQRHYGWQDLSIENYPTIGRRLLGTCDIPDLDLLPGHYGLKTIHFQAGIESKITHLGIYFLSWLVRFGLPLKLPKYARFFLKISHLFDRFGTDNGAMHVRLTGKDLDQQPITKTWFIIAKGGDGPNIPTIPAILLAERWAKGEFAQTGAFPAIDLITLEDYLEALKGLNIQTITV